VAVLSLQPTLRHRATEQRQKVDGAVLTINRDATMLGPSIDHGTGADFVLASRPLHLLAERTMINEERWCWFRRPTAPSVTDRTKAIISDP
jgi:hypothetical protein